jgi:2-succinyl-6-hydroxy-2,4-cyclohexadiene-1-carboxylate synthase
MVGQDSSVLAFDDSGRDDAARVVLVHGFTQNARCWAPFDELLGAHLGVRRVDGPGHGASPADGSDLAGAARRLGMAGGRATYLGYSMGGRMSLRLALDHPELIEALVLVSSSPGLAGADERRARRTRDDALAERIETIGVEAFVEEWLAQPLFASLGHARAHVEARHQNTAAGLAASLRLFGTGVHEPMWERLGDLAMPVLLIVGATDHKFATIAHEMGESIANATIAVIPGAGHTVHLEQPEATARLVHDWLSRHKLASLP